MPHPKPASSSKYPHREAGKDTIYRPPVHADTEEQEWNLDPLDGSGESDLSLDILDGSIFHTLFRLYGHGPVIQYAEPKDAANDRAPEVAVDQRVYPTQINIVDFNRQLRAEVENGGTDQNLDLYIGGRQYSLWGDKGTFERRDIPTVVEGYSPGTTYEPIIAVRKQPDFPPGTSRGNSVSVRIVNIDAVSDGSAQLRLTFDADVTNENDFSPPEGWDNTEAATETINVDNTAPQVDGAQQGLTVAHAFVNGSRSVSQAIEERSELPLGADTEAVLWAKSGGNATVKASMTVEEQW